MKTLRNFALIVLLIADSSWCFGQSIILEEGTTAKHGGYLNQMHAVQSALRSGRVNLNLSLSSKLELGDSLLASLSRTFNKAVPAEFFIEGVPVIELNTKSRRQGQFTKYTYATIEKNNIKTLIELIVTFEVKVEGEEIKFPKVLKIELNLAGPVKLNADKIIKEYNDRKAEDEKLPPPPRN